MPKHGVKPRAVTTPFLSNSWISTNRVFMSSPLRLFCIITRVYTAKGNNFDNVRLAFARLAALREVPITNWVRPSISWAPPGGLVDDTFLSFNMGNQVGRL